MSRWEQFVFVIQNLPWVLGSWQFPLVLLALVLTFIYLKWTES